MQNQIIILNHVVLHFEQETLNAIGVYRCENPTK